MLSRIFCILILLSGCGRPLGIQESGIESPPVWNSFKNVSLDAPLIVDDLASVEQDWWKHFRDQTLDTVLAEALDNNKNLAIAQTRIEEARAARLAAWSVLFPKFSLAGDASKGNQGFYTNGTTYYFEDASIQVNWEVDLFGKNQARLAAANAMIQNEQIMRQAVIVGLLAEVARNYFDLRNYERQISITVQNLETQKRTFQLTQEQLKGGLSSDFDVQRAGAQVSTTESRLPTLQISYEKTLNRLNVLLGNVPGEIDGLLEMEQSFQPLDQQIIVAAPATVLATRPDVRAAERSFAANISLHDAAFRELFPTVNLLGFFGAQRMTLFNTVPTWNIGTNLVMPFIDFGRIESDIETASARELRAYLTFQETVLEALEDMENALSSYLYETVRNASLRQAAEQNRKAEDLAKQQYANGFTGLLDVLIAQRNTLETESSLAESDAQLRKDLVNIYTAAGGGWACY